MTSTSTPLSQRRPVEARPSQRTWILGLASLATVVILAASFLKLLTIVAIDEYTVTATWSPAELATVDRAHLSNRAGRLEVVGGADGTVQVDVEVTDGLFRADRDERIDGDTVRVHARCTLWFTTHCRVDQHIRIPAAMPLTIDARHGDVVLRDLGGSLTSNTGFGPLVLDGIAGDAAIRHEFGELEARRLGSRSMQATHRFGNVHLHFADAPVDVRVEVEFGATVIEVPDDGQAYHVTGSSSFGNRSIQVRTDPNSERVIHLDTRFGDATIRYTS
jgi:hypothetical protein